MCLCTDMHTNKPLVLFSLQGLEVGPTDVVLHVRPCEGLVRQLDGTVEKRFAKTEQRVPLQVRHKVS